MQLMLSPISLEKVWQFFALACNPPSGIWNKLLLAGHILFLVWFAVDVARWYGQRERLGPVQIVVAKTYFPAWFAIAFPILLMPEFISFLMSLRHFDTWFCLFDRTLYLTSMSLMAFYFITLWQGNLEIRENGLSEPPSIIVKWENANSYSWTGKNNNILTLETERRTATFSIPLEILAERKDAIDSLLANWVGEVPQQENEASVARPNH